MLLAVDHAATYIDNPSKPPFEKGGLVATLLCRVFVPIYGQCRGASYLNRAARGGSLRGAKVKIVKNQIQNVEFKIQNSK